MKPLGAALKEWLRQRDWDGIAHENGSMGSTLTGWMSDGIEIDWDTLDKEIDAFAAEFEKEKK